MNQYSQRDHKWSKEKLGFGSTTIGSHGCKLTSFSMLDGRTPSELNDLFKKEGCFSGDLLYDERCASTLGWGLLPRTTDKPSVTPCIAEVDMSPAPGKQQHFVVWKEGGIIDPWTGQSRSYEMYPTVSFRNFVIPKKEEPMKKEQEDAAKKLKEMSETISRLKKSETELAHLITESRKRESKLWEDIAKCEAKLSQSQTTETSDSIDTYSLGELAGAFFRKLISIKK